jgi:hypothetical protein
MKMNVRSVILFAVTILLFSSCSANTSEVNKSNRKFNPGHYVAVGPFTDLDEINHLDEPAVQGVNKRYFWRQLEPERECTIFQK